MAALPSKLEFQRVSAAIRNYTITRARDFTSTSARKEDESYSRLKSDIVIWTKPLHGVPLSLMDFAAELGSVGPPGISERRKWEKVHSFTAKVEQ